jgi:hypothetical protein
LEGSSGHEKAQHPRIRGSEREGKALPRAMRAKGPWAVAGDRLGRWTGLTARVGAVGGVRDGRRDAEGMGIRFAASAPLVPRCLPAADAGAWARAWYEVEEKAMRAESEVRREVAAHACSAG